MKFQFRTSKSLSVVGGRFWLTVWDNPYAVALVNNVVEVRVLDQSGSNKETFVQTLTELNKARLLIRAKKGLLFAASVTQLWCIEMVDIAKQANTLLQQKKFQLALQLTVSKLRTESARCRNAFPH